ncbi:MAG: ABC transporter ATP-binding protein [Deltaproteobacteria bacterium]|nr:ABC transporter ATP-binding protein [Deltaproteobacteria bacterium]
MKIKNITKRYFRTVALNKVSFEVSEGSITGVIGPNGAGKSTLLDIISGFQNPDEGEIYFNDRPLTLMLFKEKKKVLSYMPEHLEIYPDYYVDDFIRFLHGATRYIDTDLIDILNLAKVKNKKIRYLSKGYHQRLKLFFALSNTKKIMVLDEPFDGFDPIQLIDILEFIRSENRKGRTFILSIHQLYDAEKICSHYVLLNQGKVVTQGSIQTLKQTFGDDSSSLEQIFMRAIE